MDTVIKWLLGAIFFAIFMTIALPMLGDLLIGALALGIAVAFMIFVIRLLLRAGRGSKSNTTHHHHYHR